jgi:hypothetical protein
MVFIMGLYIPNSFVVLYGVIMVHMDSVYCMEVPKRAKSLKTVVKKWKISGFTTMNGGTT